MVLDQGFHRTGLWMDYVLELGVRSKIVAEQKKQQEVTEEQRRQEQLRRQHEAQFEPVDDSDNF
jgi:hypothetical protein